MRHLLLILVLLGGTLGCSVGQKKSVLTTAFHEDERRHEYFEATLRVLEEKPEYVDEFCPSEPPSEGDGPIRRQHVARSP
jgi:hypothetical protein